MIRRGGREALGPRGGESNPSGQGCPSHFVPLIFRGPVTFSRDTPLVGRADQSTPTPKTESRLRAAQPAPLQYGRTFC